jgi:hypothetical protein
LALQERHGEKGEKHTKTKPPVLPPISQLKSRLRQALWNQAVEDVVKVSHEKPVVRPASLPPGSTTPVNFSDRCSMGSSDRSRSLMALVPIMPVGKNLSP